ncbi:hypothetical protein P7C70_g1497, partial [Phenoliferia sp. Uapishka_3]
MAIKPLAPARSNPRELRPTNQGEAYKEAINYERRSVTGALMAPFRGTNAEALALLSVTPAMLKAPKAQQEPRKARNSSTVDPKTALLGKRSSPARKKKTNSKRRVEAAEDSAGPTFSDDSDSADSDTGLVDVPHVAHSPVARSVRREVVTETSVPDEGAATESEYEAQLGDAESDDDSDDSQSGCKAKRVHSNSPSATPSPVSQSSLCGRSRGLTLTVGARHLQAKPKAKSNAQVDLEAKEAKAKFTLAVKEATAQALLKSKKAAKARAKAKAKAKLPTPVNPNTKTKAQVSRRFFPFLPTRTLAHAGLSFPCFPTQSSPDSKPHTGGDGAEVGLGLSLHDLGFDVDEKVPKAHAKTNGKGQKRLANEAEYEGTTFPVITDVDLPAQDTRKRPKRRTLRHEGGTGSGKKGQFTVNDMDPHEKATYAGMCKEIRIRLVCAGRPWASAGDLVAEVNDMLATARRQLGLEIEWHSGFQALLYQNAKSWISKCGFLIKGKTMEKYALKWEFVDRHKGTVEFGKPSRAVAAAALESCENLRADGQARHISLASSTADVNDDDNLMLGSLLHEAAVCLLGPMIDLPELVLEEGIQRKHCVLLGFGLLGIAYAGILRTLDHAKLGRGSCEFTDDYQIEANNLALAGRSLSVAQQDVILLKLWSAAGAHSAGLGKMVMVAATAEAAKASLFRRRGGCDSGKEVWDNRTLTQANESETSDTPQAAPRSQGQRLFASDGAELDGIASHLRTPRPVTEKRTLWERTSANVIAIPAGFADAILESTREILAHDMPSFQIALTPSGPPQPPGPPGRMRRSSRGGGMGTEGVSGFGEADGSVEARAKRVKNAAEKSDFMMNFVTQTQEERTFEGS